MQSKAHNESALKHLQKRQHTCTYRIQLSLCVCVCGAAAYVKRLPTLAGRAHWATSLTRCIRFTVHFHFHFSFLSLAHSLSPPSLSHSRLLCLLCFYFNFYLSSIRIHLVIASVDNLALACLISSLTVFSRSLRLAAT